MNHTKFTTLLHLQHFEADITALKKLCFLSKELQGGQRTAFSNTTQAKDQLICERIVQTSFEY